VFKHFASYQGYPNVQMGFNLVRKVNTHSHRYVTFCKLKTRTHIRVPWQLQEGVTLYTLWASEVNGCGPQASDFVSLVFLESTLNTECRIWWIPDGTMTELNTETVGQISALSAHIHKHKQKRKHTHTHTSCSYRCKYIYTYMYIASRSTENDRSFIAAETFL
jgi:hypothetical protein